MMMMRVLLIMMLLHMTVNEFHDDDDFLGSVVFTESRLRIGTQPLGRD